MLKESIQPIYEQNTIGYDIAASVFLLRQELKDYGHIRNEMAARVRMEELSTVAEMLNAVHDKTYVLESINGRLAALDGSLLSDIFRKGKEIAHNQYEIDEKAEFWLKRQIDFEEEGVFLEEFANKAEFGDVYISTSPYPEEAENQFGKEYIKTFGPDPMRKTAFVYLYQRSNNGELMQRVISLDKSNKHAIRSVLNGLGASIPQDETTDNYLRYGVICKDTTVDKAGNYIISDYDKIIGGQLNTKTFMGRDDEHQIDAWSFIEKHSAIYDEHQKLLFELANSDVHGSELRKKAIELNTGFWRLMKEYLELERSSGQHHIDLPPNSSYGQQLTWALNRALESGDSFNGGCVSLTINQLHNMNEQNIIQMIFGANPDKWEWKKGYCRVNNCPSKPHPTKVGPCDVCVACQGYFDKGKQPEKIYSTKNIGSRKRQEKPNEIIEALKFWFSGF
jgi:hypothetical protein